MECRNCRFRCPNVASGRVGVFPSISRSQDNPGWKLLWSLSNISLPFHVTDAADDRSGVVYIGRHGSPRHTIPGSPRFHGFPGPRALPGSQRPQISHYPQTIPRSLSSGTLGSEAGATGSRPDHSGHRCHEASWAPWGQYFLHQIRTGVHRSEVLRSY